MSLARYVSAAVLFLVAAGCAPGGEAVSVSTGNEYSAGATDRAADVEVIRGLGEEWLQAMRAGDIDRLASMYATDAVIYEPGLPPITGAPGLRMHFEELAALDVRVMESDVREVEVAASGELAYETGDSYWQWVTAEGEMSDRSRYLLVWRKEDGAWRIAREIFNSESTGAP